MNLEDVILEERQKKDILTAVTSFQQFKVYQKRHAAKNAAHFSESFARGCVKEGGWEVGWMGGNVEGGSAGGSG